MEQPEKRDRTIHFTKEMLDQLVPEDALVTWWDDKNRGLGFRITPTGSKSFVFKYRIGRRQGFLTLGRYGALTLDGAKKKATRFQGMVLEGVDPAQEKRERLTAMTFEKAGEQFLEEHGPHLRESTLDDYTHKIEKVIAPFFQKVLPKDLSPADVARLHHSLRETPRKADITLTVLTELCQYLERWGERPVGSNPCKLQKRFEQNQRDRYLTDMELGAVGEALGQMEADGSFDNVRMADVFRLLIFTGARKNEIARLRWKWVDIENTRLTLPASAHKTGKKSRVKVIPLGAPAVALLKALATGTLNTYVFPGRKASEPVGSGVDKAWIAIRARVKANSLLARLENPKAPLLNIDDVTIHDLRHTWGATGTGLGITGKLVGAVLGHRHSASTDRYAHVAPSPAQQAAEATSQSLAAKLQGVG